MSDPLDYEFYVGRHLNNAKFPLQDLHKKGLILRQKFLFEEKKKLDQLSQSIKQSCYEINIANLQTSSLMSNIKFKNLVGLIEEHNKIIRLVKIGQSDPNDLIIQCEFHKELDKLLKQVMQFTSAQPQIDYLEQVHLWSLKARNIKPTISMKQSNHVDPSNVPELKIPPSIAVQQEMAQFINGTRTWHKDIEPVKERLKAYNYRKLISQISTADTTQLPLSGLTTKRTFPNQYPKQDFLSPIEQNSLVEEEQLVNNLLAAKESIFDEQVKDEEEGEQGSQDDDQSSKEKKKSVSLAPDKKYFLRDCISTRPTSLQRDYENKSTFLNYISDSSNIEISLQRRWLLHQKYEQSKKKEDQEMIQLMTQYVKKRSRIEKEINRRIDSKIQGSAYQVTYKKEELEQSEKERLYNQIFEEQNDKQTENKESTENIQPSFNSKTIIGLNQLKLNKLGPKTIVDHTLSIQQQGFTEKNPEKLGSQISSARVKNLIKYNKDILNLSVDDQINEIKKPHSLSVYDKDGLDLNPINRPLSVVYQKKSSFIYDELKEVLDVKQRLAKYRIVVPTRKLVNSLVTPEANLNKTFDQHQFYEKDLQIPQPGFGISPNPFEDEGKKQSKNKKKK